MKIGVVGIMTATLLESLKGCAEIVEIKAHPYPPDVPAEAYISDHKEPWQERRPKRGRRKHGR